jgi:hypothetical protein
LRPLRRRSTLRGLGGLGAFWGRTRSDSGTLAGDDGDSRSVMVRSPFPSLPDSIDDCCVGRDGE